MANIFKKKYSNFQIFFAFCLLILAILFAPSFVRAQVDYISNIDMQGHAIKGMADPVDPSDATTKNYVDLVAGGGGSLPGGSTGQTLYNSSGSWLASSNLYHNGTNVGIGTAIPGAKLHVVGAGIFTGTVEVDTPVDPGHATTKAYVDSVAGGGGSLPTGTHGQTFYNSSGTWTATSNLYHNGTNVGINDTTPSYKFEVHGTGNFTGTVGVATPTANNHAVTKSYADSMLVDPIIDGDLNMNWNDITNVNKLTVNTIDPLYEINNVLYSTYAASVVGGVKEEYIGKTTINSYNSSKGEYEKVIDFKDQEEGTELWVWYKTVDFNEDNVDIFMTPYGSMASVYYEVVDDSIILRSDKSVDVSYRLIGRRFDWKSWPTITEDQTETAGLKID